jgi:hypothetical protein
MKRIAGYESFKNIREWDQMIEEGALSGLVNKIKGAFGKKEDDDAEAPTPREETEQERMVNSFAELLSQAVAIEPETVTSYKDLGDYKSDLAIVWPIGDMKAVAFFWGHPTSGPRTQRVILGIVEEVDPKVLFDPLISRLSDYIIMGVSDEDYEEHIEKIRAAYKRMGGHVRLLPCTEKMTEALWAFIHAEHRMTQQQRDEREAESSGGMLGALTGAKIAARGQ